MCWPNVSIGRDPLSPSPFQGLPPRPSGKSWLCSEVGGGCGASTFAPLVDHRDQDRRVSRRPKPAASLGVLSSPSPVAAAAVLSGVRASPRSTLGSRPQPLVCDGDLGCLCFWLQVRPGPALLTCASDAAASRQEAGAGGRWQPGTRVITVYMRLLIARSEMMDEAAGRSEDTVWFLGEPRHDAMVPHSCGVGCD